MASGNDPSAGLGHQSIVDPRLATPLPCTRCSVKSFNVCRPLDYERQKELFETGIQQTWKRRQSLFRAGDPLGPIFKITSGIVAVSNSLPDGRRQVLDFFLPGEICGFLESHGRYSFDGEAITRVTTCSFSRPRFKTFIGSYGDVAEAVTVALASKLESVSQHMAVVGQLTSTERVATFLCRLSAGYSAHNLRTRPLAIPMKRADIADYLGLRLETVSRAFSKLKRRRIIEFSEDDVIVLDQARLSAASGP